MQSENIWATLTIVAELVTELICFETGNLYLKAK